MQAWDQNVFNFVAHDGLVPLQSPPDQPRLVRLVRAGVEKKQYGHTAFCTCPGSPHQILRVPRPTVRMRHTVLVTLGRSGPPTTRC